MTPDTSASPDPESTSFVGPFDSDQLPPEVQNAVYDPRMFSNHELYIDPDIIGWLVVSFVSSDFYAPASIDPGI